MSLSPSIKTNAKARPTIVGQKSVCVVLDCRDLPRRPFEQVSIGRIALLVAMAWVVLVSCSTEDTTQGTGTVGGDETVVVSVEMLATELGEVRTSGGVLKYPTNFCADPDPAIDRSIAWRNIGNPPVVTEIHAGLTRVNEFGTDGYELALASSVRVSDDLREYEFTLRPSLKFSDGSPLTSRDVKWSWERGLSFGAETTNAWRVLGAIEGADEVLGKVGELEGVEVIDDRRLRVRLERPFVGFPMHLTHPVASVLSRRNVESWPARSSMDNTSVLVTSFDYSYEVVGAGPFKLLQVDGGPFGARSCSLERNPHYWGESPSLARVDLVSVSDPIPIDGELTPPRSHEAFAQGEIDVALPDHDGSDSELSIEDGLPRTFAPVQAEIRYGMLAFNPAVPPFDDIGLRHALVDVTELPADLLGDWAVGADRRIIPRSIFRGSVPRVVDSDESVGGESRPDGAYAGLVIEATFDLEPPDTYGVLVHDLVAQWEEGLGLTVRLNSEPLAYDNAFNSGDLPFRLLRGSLGVPEPLHLLRSLVFAFGGGDLPDEFLVASEMLTAAESEPDSVVREQMALDIERHLLENALVLPLTVFESQYEVRVRHWVKGFEYYAYPHSLFANVWLEDAPPERYE